MNPDEDKAESDYSGKMDQAEFWIYFLDYRSHDIGCIRFIILMILTILPNTAGLEGAIWILKETKKGEQIRLGKEQIQKMLTIMSFLQEGWEQIQWHKIV